MNSTSQADVIAALTLPALLIGADERIHAENDASRAMLGAGIWRSILFGVATGVLGYLLCATLLDLNLPEGELYEAIAETFEKESS